MMRANHLKIAWRGDASVCMVSCRVGPCSAHDTDNLLARCHGVMSPLLNTSQASHHPTFHISHQTKMNSIIQFTWDRSRTRLDFMGGKSLIDYVGWAASLWVLSGYSSSSSGAVSSTCSQHRVGTMSAAAGTHCGLCQHWPAAHNNTHNTQYWFTLLFKRCPTNRYIAHNKLTTRTKGLELRNEPWLSSCILQQQQFTVPFQMLSLKRQTLLHNTKLPLGINCLKWILSLSYFNNKPAKRW